jgi:hypothetical protein
MGKREAWIILIFMVLATVQLVFMVLALMELRSLTPVFAQDDKLSRQTLRGIKGVHVVIEFLKPEIEEDGLTEDRLRKEAELKFQKAGIKVLSERENQMAPGRPQIYMNLNILKYKYFPVYIYHNRVELVQDVYLGRASTIRTGAVTWSISTAGVATSLEGTKASMENLMDYFLDAYVSVNPKQRQSQTS